MRENTAAIIAEIQRNKQLTTVKSYVFTDSSDEEPLDEADKAYQALLDQKPSAVVKWPSSKFEP